MPLRVLVIDDEPGIRRQLSYLLEDEGYEVASVESGAAAIEAARASPFDVVIVDVRLPDISGISVFSTLTGSDSSLHAIIISGHAVQDEIQEARAAGAQFMSKPLDAQRLLELVANWRGQKEASP